MKNASVWYLLGLLSLGDAAWSQTEQAGGGTEKAIAALENQWLESYKTNNPDLVAPLLAEKFVGTDTEGKVMNKAQSLAEAKATKNASAEYENVKVTAFGDAAIATGDYKGKGTDASGKPFDVHTRWTDTWGKMPTGKWQCVASQDTPVKM
jgi:ketosteroid isomerase-like protein